MNDHLYLFIYLLNIYIAPLKGIYSTALDVWWVVVNAANWDATPIFVKATGGLSQPMVSSLQFRCFRIFQAKI